MSDAFNTRQHLPLRVALIDGAVDLSHPAFADARIEVLKTAEPLSAPCRNADSPSCQHGTFMAGLILGTEPDQHLSPASAPTLLLRPIFCQASDLQQCPRVDEQELSQAIHESIDAGARLVNMSLGLDHMRGQPGPRLMAAYERAQREGVLLVAAAGNQGAEGVNPLFRHPWVLPVTAHDATGRILPSANQGPWLAEHGLSALGEALQGPAAGGGWRRMSGTSAAAAWVSGQAAALWAANCNATAHEIRGALRRSAYLAADAAIPRLQLTALLAPTSRPSEESSDMYSHSLVPSSADPIPAYTDYLPRGSTQLYPQACDCDCDSGTAQFIYAIGTLRPVFPSLDIQMEFEAQAQLMNLGNQDYFQVLRAPNDANFYLAWLMCWVLTINNVDTYIVRPRSEIELNDFIKTLDPGGVGGAGNLSTTTTLVIGQRRKTVAAGACDSLQLPTVICSQVYYFNESQLLAQLVDSTIEVTAVRDVLKSLDFKPNDGASAADRAINYVAIRYPEVYRKTTTLKRGSPPSGGLGASGSSDAQFLAGITTQVADAHTGRDLVDVIFKYQNNRTGEQTFWYCSIDVTGMFPFLNTPLRSYTPIVAGR